MTNDELNRLARLPQCPRCDLDKTFNSALCRKCRGLLPPNMRNNLESISSRDSFSVMRSIRAAANYFSVHFKSIREFGGGKKR